MHAVKRLWCNKAPTIRRLISALSTIELRNQLLRHNCVLALISHLHHLRQVDAKLDNAIHNDPLLSNRPYRIVKRLIRAPYPTRIWGLNMYKSVFNSSLITVDVISNDRRTLDSSQNLHKIHSKSTRKSTIIQNHGRSSSTCKPSGRVGV